MKGRSQSRTAPRKAIPSWMAGKPSWAFWVLAGLLTLTFITGGSSKPSVASLMILRPAALLAVGFALATIRIEHVKAYWPLIALCLAVLLLTASHLIPLPPSIWQALPGRQIIADIDAAAGLEGVWRPLSMVTDGTWNALYSLSVPVAVLLLVIQLDRKDHLKLLLLIIGLCLLSGLVGVLQASGQDIRLYQVSSANAGLFANRNHQGVMLALLLPMLFTMARNAHRITPEPRAIRLVTLALFLAVIPLVMITGSRAGLALSITSILFVAVMWLQGKSGAKRSARLLPRSVTFAIGGALIAAMTWLTVFLSRDVAISRLANNEEGLRVDFWENIWAFLPSYMPWGSGIGSFVEVYQLHEPAAQLMPLRVNHAHNDWLEVLMTAGIPGAALLVAAAAIYLSAIWRSERLDSFQKSMSQAGNSILLILVLASVVDYPLRTSIMAALCVVGAAWLWGGNSNRAQKESDAIHA
jgi:O-antigen ligase